MSLGCSVVDAFVASGLVESRNAARRVIAEGGASVNNVKVTDGEALPGAGDFLSGRSWCCGEVAVRSRPLACRRYDARGLAPRRAGTVASRRVDAEFDPALAYDAPTVPRTFRDPCGRGTRRGRATVDHYRSRRPLTSRFGPMGCPGILFHPSAREGGTDTTRSP